MQLAAGHDLSVSFITRQLFSGLNFTIQSNSHVGLVGMNGGGKTTLFKVMRGKIKPDTGMMVYSKETKIAYMEQFLLADEDMTLVDAVKKVFQELIDLEIRLGELNSRLEQEHTPALLDEQHKLQEQYQDKGGYTYAMRLRSALLGLGFGENDFDLPVSTLSGGQRSKAALAKVLLSDANLLLLDEPTNHLDIESIEWLESFLGTYRGAFIVISHDRYFLDKVTNETWALEHGGLRCFSGNYSAHLEKKESEDEALRRQYQNQMREIRRIEGIVTQQKRFNQARNFVTIASKQKQINKLKAGLVRPEQDEKTLSFQFNSPPPGGNDVLELFQVAKSYGGNKLFDHVELKVQKGEKIFLLGMNGCGKTTLMKIIMGEQSPDKGEVRLGISIFPSYYDQIQNSLKDNESILEHLTNCYPMLTQTRIRTMLGSFLFSAESVDKSIDCLSGGEKARLELLKLILQPTNLLLLDEPTNHLDIESREAVEKALFDYPGSMLVISHDRYLINRLADRIYYLNNDGLTKYLGNYDDYLEMLSDDQVNQYQKAQKSPALSLEEPALVNQPSDSALEYRRCKEEQAELRRLAKKISEIKEEILKLEKELEIISEQIDVCAPSDYMLLMELSSQKDALEEKLLSLMEELEFIVAESNDACTKGK